MICKRVSYRFFKKVPLYWYVLLTVCLGFLYTHSGYAQRVRVAAAADLRYAMDDIVAAYKKSNPRADIEVIYGSSGNVYTQIFNGAPYDMYFSADIMYPQKLFEAGLALDAPKLYAIGRLVLWSSRYDVSAGLSVLQQYPNARIAIANPSHAPYGKRAVESLKHYSLYASLKSRLLYGENVSQAAQFCITGNAQFGIVALSLAVSPQMAKHGSYYLIDNASHEPLRQGYILTNRAQNNAVAHDFARFIESQEARRIFSAYGFTLE